MKLKTLKDLKVFNWNEDEYENMDILNEEYSKGKKATLLREEAITTNELKAEAVKWVKEIEKIDFRETLKTKDKQVVINTQNKKSIANWIKGFFNISEEDLK